MFPGQKDIKKAYNNIIVFKLLQVNLDFEGKLIIFSILRRVWGMIAKVGLNYTTWYDSNDERSKP
jgi:hypothetical protein